MWNDESKLWPTILKGEKENWIMTTSSYDGQSDKNDTASELGIVYGHAYSLLAGYEVQSQGKTVKLVKIRNPWGGTEWKGKWSDKCPQWNTLSRDTIAKLEGNDRQ